MQARSTLGGWISCSDSCSCKWWATFARSVPKKGGGSRNGTSIPGRVAHAKLGRPFFRKLDPAGPAGPLSPWPPFAGSRRCVYVRRTPMAEPDGLPTPFDEFLDRFLRGDEIDVDDFLSLHPGLSPSEIDQIRQL